MTIIVSGILTITLFFQAALLFLVSRAVVVSRARSFFILYLTSLSLWTLLILLNLFAVDNYIEHGIFAVAALALTAQVWFARSFGNSPSLSWSNFWVSLIGIFFVFASFLPGAMFSSFTIKEGYGVIENGYLSSVYSLFVLAFSLLPIFIFLRLCLHESNQKLRSQYKMLAWGFFLFLIVSVLTNSVLPVFFGWYFFNSIGPVFSLILASTVFYIIWRHEFLGIRVIIERGLFYLPLFVLLTAAYFEVLSLLREIWTAQIVAGLTGFIFLVTGVFAIYWVERYFQHRQLLSKEREYRTSLERQVAERTEELRSLQEYQNKMTYEIAHALQTPLTVLKAAASEDNRNLIDDSTDRLSRLTYNLIRLSRLESIPLLSLNEVFSLSAVVKETSEYVGTLCDGHGITLKTNIEAGISIKGDRSEWEEVLTNLLSNAVRHTANTNKVEKYIKVTLNTKELMIEDNGEGIPPERLSEIFLPFHRLSSDQRGNGLGLAIVDRIVRRHGGTIKAESQLGEGTTFTITLPPLSE